MSNILLISKIKIEISNSLPGLALNSKKKIKKIIHWIMIKILSQATASPAETSPRIRLFAKNFIDYNTVKHFRCSCIKLYSSVSNISAKPIIQYA
ncbi:hypothetical protein GIB67_024435 [Kingdonia uniflora]|uniref:Uncharacterized protein n=1 Tax=Kingdonia uniflora TaxID=39325 RepID=A0A7J7P523_9MAGN|nr:hypothetical protein GIB67_024435 [Kingdonia uniflora]